MVIICSFLLFVCCLFVCCVFMSMFRLARLAPDWLTLTMWLAKAVEITNSCFSVFPFPPTKCWDHKHEPQACFIGSQGLNPKLAQARVNIQVTSLALSISFLRNGNTVALLWILAKLFLSWDKFKIFFFSLWDYKQIAEFIPSHFSLQLIYSFLISYNSIPFLIVITCTYALHIYHYIICYIHILVYYIFIIHYTLILYISVYYMCVITCIYMWAPKYNLLCLYNVNFYLVVMVC